MGVVDVCCRRRLTPPTLLGFWPPPIPIELPAPPMPSTSATDQDLMRRVAAGDAGAFRELFDQHASKVLGMLIQLLRRRELAEELLQEVFLHAWSRAGDYRPQRATPAGWLLMLARSRALDRLRAEGARRRREEASGTDPTRPAAVAAVGTEQLEVEERRRAVVSALGELPDDQRRCLELAFYQGLSQSRIAERLDLPLGTVKSRIRIAMNKVRVAVEPSHRP